MAPEGRAAGAVLPAERLKSLAAGQEGQIDIVALGMVTNGAGHGKTPFSVSGFWFLVFS
jgi:hypothetical protein